MLGGEEDYLEQQWRTLEQSKDLLNSQWRKYFADVDALMRRERRLNAYRAAFVGSRAIAEFWLAVPPVAGGEIRVLQSLPDAVPEGYTIQGPFQIRLSLGL